MGASEASVIKAFAACLPQSVVKAVVDNPDLQYIRGQFVQGTTVFADISGFTSLSETLSQLGKEGAEELTNILNRYFTDMLDIAFSYGGIQVKFGGDAMFLLFDGPNHAARALRCAFRMQKAMARFRRVHTSKGPFRLEMSIGINTGEFFEANLGISEQRIYYVLTGREVNRLAEMEGVAGKGEIVISGSARDELGNSVQVEPKGQGYYLAARLYARVSRTQRYQLNLDDKELATIIDKLGCYVPRLLAERIKGNPEGRWIKSEHRRTTIMFVNVLGASEAIERHGREKVGESVKILNNCFNTVHSIVQKFGGIVIGCDLNVTGDKLLIVFGAPVAHEDDDERAVQCALEIREQITGRRLPLQQRIGINSGYVFSGEVGSPLRKEYTLIGDHVNLAARLMDIAREGEILIGQSTYNLTCSRFIIQPREPTKVKGMSEPVAVHEVLGTREDMTKENAPRTVGLFGREEEVRILWRVGRQVLTGKGQVLAISGVAGIGKSRLAEEMKSFWKSWGGSIYSGNSQINGLNTPYLPWANLFSSFFGLRSDDTNEQRRGKVEKVMLDLCPALGEWTAVMGNLLNTAIPESDMLKSLDAKLRHQRLLDVTLELLRAQAKEKPVLLLFDDFQFADTASIELLNYVARNIVGDPLLICLAYRPDERLALEVEEQEYFTRMVLNELSAESSLNLVKSIVSMEKMPEALGQLIATRAQGNPFFVEELVRTLIDTGNLLPDASREGYYLAKDLEKVDIPDTIYGAIMTRLDRMDEETRDVLRVASVIGQFFEYRTLRDIFPYRVTDEELLYRLVNLTGLGVITTAKEGPVSEYYFRHVLAQEVTYESLPYARRRELHHKVGDYLEKQNVGSLEEYCELLFYHYDRARDSSKALNYSVKAGDKARKLYINQEAITYYRRAIELTAQVSGAGGGLKSRVLESLGDVYELTGQYDQALDSYKASQRWCQFRQGAKTGSRRRAAVPPTQITPISKKERTRQISALCHKRAIVYERKGSYDTAIEWLDRGLNMLGTRDRQRARLFLTRAGILYRKGRTAEALDWSRRALITSRSIGNPDDIAHSYYLLDMIYTDLGNIGRAIMYRHRALDIYEETGDLLGQARVLNNLGVDCYYEGNWDKAKGYYHKSLQIREKIGDITGVATVSNNLGEVLSDQGYLDDAIKSFMVCLESWERIGYVLGVGLSSSNLGRAYTRQGDWRKALEHLEKSSNIFERLQSRAFLAEVCQRMAEAYLGMGQIQKAMDLCERSLALALELKMPVTQGAVCRTLGQVYRTLGEWDEAEQMLNESQKILRELGAQYELSRTLWQLALLNHEISKSDIDKTGEANMREPLEEAVAIFKELGIILYDAQVAKLSSL